MVEIYSVIGIIVGLFLISISLIKLKNQTISQGTFTLWILVGIVLIIVSSVPVLIFEIQNILGTEFTLSAVLGIAISFLIIVVFYLHQKVDSLNQQITKLIAELGAKKFQESLKSKDE